MAATRSSTFWSRLPSSRAFYICINALQMMAGITTLSLCGSDISDFKDDTPRKAFTMTVSTLSIITSLSLMTEIFHSVATRLWLVLVFLWQWVLVFLWGTAAIVMSTAYLRGSTRTRMRVATVFVYFNLVVWALCSLVGTIGCCAVRRRDDNVQMRRTKDKKDRWWRRRGKKSKSQNQNQDQTDADADADAAKDDDSVETGDAQTFEMRPLPGRGSAST
ncbi:hypothetical protein PV10_02681 [Exophiala mesophila]|uniref:MARVEL domain-containing protein n=1 Tax=Exophiala mesophila TaxID=212818 RepID=A0A0D2A7M0_EXOME|nr:uncharacterized protein PV10_02681 [Exophiala mesophila]KIV94968.1 hypothetical protein PV10_02681 [Exophiala mesophila]